MLHTKIIKLKQPIFLINKIGEWNAKLSFGIITMKNLKHKQILINNLKPGPKFLNGTSLNKHGMLLIKPLIAIDPSSINNHQPLIPPAKYLRPLPNLAINVRPLNHRLRHPRNSLLQRMELQPHQFDFTCDQR